MANETVELLDVREAAQLLRVTAGTLYKYSCGRRIPFVKINGRLLFDRRKLLKFVEEHSVAPLNA